MDCEFTIKISQLIDGELSTVEAEQLHQHLTSCVICQQAEADFLHLRQEIQHVEFVPDPFEHRRALSQILTSQTILWWRRKVALPIPVFALLLIAVVTIGTWAIRRGELPDTRNQSTGKLPEHQVTTQQTPSGFDLSRF